jgi:hypothetical protein
VRRYINDQGLVDYRIEVSTAPRRSWRWLVLLVGLIVLIDVGLAYLLRLGLHG